VDLAATLALMPPGSLVPAEWVLAQLRTAEETPGKAILQAGGDLTVEEVATRMHRKPSTVRGWLSTGALCGYKLQGRDWRVTEEAIQEFLSAQRDGHAGASDSRTVRSRARAGALDLGAWRKVRGAGGGG
jgi:excisionase family DNA binding protein